jgi:hypothetical protein
MNISQSLRRTNHRSGIEETEREFSDSSWFKAWRERISLTHFTGSKKAENPSTYAIVPERAFLHLPLKDCVHEDITHFRYSPYLTRYIREPG